MTSGPPTFHFFTLVTKDAQYDAMRATLDTVGFDEANSLFTILDNREGNHHEPYSAITKAVRGAQAPYVVFCHQDLLFQRGPDDLLNALEALEAADPTWAVVGNAGYTPDYKEVFCLDDHNGSHEEGPFPGRVVTLDENFLVIKRSSGVGCSEGLSGFHLYATDLCLNAYQKGHSAYVIEYRLEHTGSSLDYAALDRQSLPFEKVWKRRVGGAVLQTPAMVLVVSRLPFFHAALIRSGIARKLRWHPEISRRIDRMLRPWRAKWLPSG